MITQEMWQEFLDSLIKREEERVNSFLDAHYEEMDDVPKEFWRQYDAAGKPHFNTWDKDRNKAKEIHSSLYEARRQIAADALKKGDYEILKKYAPKIFPVRLCKREHMLYHGLLPHKDGTVIGSERLTPEEYVDRLEIILEDGLKPSRNREHNFSDPEIPATYFSVGCAQCYPWGPVVVVTHANLVEEPVFKTGIYNPFTDDGRENDHLIYSDKRIKPAEPFRIWLKPFSDAGYYDIEEYQRLVNELNRKKIIHTLAPYDSDCELPYHEFKQNV